MENQVATIKREKTLIKTLGNSEEVHFVKTTQRDNKTFKIWECGICAREFQHCYTLARHLPVHSNARNYPCPECGKSFRQLSTLNQHMAIHSRERPFVCDHCDKSFNRVSTLISHKKIHSDVKQYICKYCDKAFHQKGNLKNHIFIHTNARPYLCILCDKGFNQMSNLVCHKKKCHPNPDGNPTVVKNNNELKKKVQKKSDVIEFMIAAIKTEALSKAKENNEIPFALLHLLKGNIIIVRVIDCGALSLIREARKEDFETLKKSGDAIGKITLPMVADIHQILGFNGTLEYAIRPPEADYNFLRHEPIEPIKKSIEPIMIKKEEISETFDLPTQLIELKNVSNKVLNETLDGIERDAWLSDGKPKMTKTAVRTEDKIVDVEDFNEDSSSSSLDLHDYNVLINAINSDGLLPDFDGIKNYFTENEISFNF